YLFIVDRCVRSNKQIAEKAVYLFTVDSPRQANRRKSRLSIHGEFAATSNSPEKPFICSRRVRRGPQNGERAVYRFAARRPGQETRSKRRLSVGGEWTAASEATGMPFICSRTVR